MENNGESHLVFMEQIQLLGLESKQSRHVKSSQQTQETIVNTLISAVASKSSLEIGKAHLDLISDCIFSVLSRIRASSNPDLAFETVLKWTSPDSHRKLFSSSRQAISDNLPQDSKSNLDHYLHMNYRACMKELEKERAKSTEVMLAIDTTPQEAKSKYLNNQYSYVHKGQQNLWKRGHTFSGIYDCTHQLFISNLHQNSHKSKHEAGSVQAFISQIQDACRVVEDVGSTVELIGGDRGYYDGELYAAAYFGQLSLRCKNPSQIRVVIPKKFTRGKEDKKIAFLEDPNSTLVSLDYIQLSKYTHPTLIDFCKASGMKTVDSMYLIPVVSVALVDEYGGKNKRSLSQLKHEWAQTKINITNSTQRLKTLQSQYIDLQKQAGIAKPKAIAKITKRKRNFFRNPKLYNHYKLINSTISYIEGLKTSQQKILNALLFFSISLSENENPLDNPEKFIIIAKAYHERWGIESGFKEDKEKFLRCCQSRKSTQRQWNLSLGMSLYNRWHVTRMKAMLKFARKKAWNVVPWTPHQTYLRRKLERKFGRVLKAESFLLQILKDGIESCLDRIFKR